MINKNIPFRQLYPEFMKELESGKLRYILQFERKHRKSFMVEIRNNHLDLYFLGHSIKIKISNGKYLMIANDAFNPKDILSGYLKERIKRYESESNKDKSHQWCFFLDDIRSYEDFEELIMHVILKIVEHKRGSISEDVSEINHFIDNRDIGKNGILVIDRQVVYPGSQKDRIDLLGLRRVKGNEYTFVVIELKNKNNTEIGQVFSQTKRYIDKVYDNYEHFRITYLKVLEQKMRLGILKKRYIIIMPSDMITKKDIKGIVIMDNYNIRSDLKNHKNGGLLHRAINDWKRLNDDYEVLLFLKTNVLDDTFFMDLSQTEHLLDRYKKKNLE